MMKIENNSKVMVNNTNSASANKTQISDSPKFSDELTSLATKEAKETEETKETKETQKAEETKESKEAKETEETKETKETQNVEETKETKETELNKNKENEEPNGIKKDKNKGIDSAIDGLKNMVEEISKNKNDDSLNQTKDKSDSLVKEKLLDADKKNEEDNFLINNDVNITENKDQLTPQMNANMNFNSNGQPFAAFVEQKDNDTLSATKSELAEEVAILSTMGENIAIATKNMMLKKGNEQNNTQETPEKRTVTNEKGIKKVDTKTNVTVETVVKFDEVVMDRNDVDFFTQLVENGSVDMTKVEGAEKSSQVSKTLADMLAKSMKDNQPVRIDFDNNISVIIKVSKDGKISADFLPSSQVAEAYLRENLPLLKQRFDDNDIEYESLNQRKQQDNRNDDRKKGRKDE